MSDIPGNRPEDEVAERIAELEDVLKSAVAALHPFALAFTETRQVSSIPDEKVWIWKPSDNKRETHGISRANLKTAADVLASIDASNLGTMESNTATN